MLRRHRLYCCSDLHASKESSVNMYTGGYEDLHSWSHRSRWMRDDRPHQPGLAKLQLFASRDQELKHGGKTYAVKAAASLESSAAPRGELGFVALDDEHSKRYVPRLLELGYRVMDKSNTFRADPNVPLVTAGVNHDIVTHEVRLVANPNCTTIPLALSLWPLHQRFGLSREHLSSRQWRGYCPTRSVSGKIASRLR